MSTPSFMQAIELAPRDPILGISEAFQADGNPRKVNLGVGVYCDDSGKIPVLACVREAERRLAEKELPRGYLPIDGIAEYNRLVLDLVFGVDHPALSAGRVLAVQTLGGTGALRVGADFLRRFNPGAGVWISDPSWENHRALFEAAGLTVHTYPYYDPDSGELDFPAMLAALERLPAQSTVLLHACCHNPTGVDLSPDQWDELIELVRARGLIPFLDMAYQGFADGVDQDASVVRRFAARCPVVLVSNSFSKSFSLYGERVGGLSVVAEDADQVRRALSQIKRIVRTNYSNPPTHGAKVVASVLGDAELRVLWERELGAMRGRIQTMREALAQRLAAHLPGRDFGYMVRQRGMFSYSRLGADQVARLREQHAVYAVDTGRICIAALNTANLDHVAAGVASCMGA